MALILADRVKETTTTTGTGTVTLLGASTGYQSFSAIGNGNTTYYTIASQTLSEWEVGIGTYTSSGTTLSRDTVLASSNSGSAVNFSAGTKDVFVTYPSEKSINQDSSGNVVLASTTAANYLKSSGAATTYTPTFAALGSDTNVSLAIKTQGTGAIDLAAGSSGVNISNGGTVTAITRTATGSLYTGFPTLTISAPTTAGGVQATATPQLVAANTTIVSGGTGYTAGDVLTVTTSGGSSTINITVTSVSGGVINTATASSAALTSIPSGTVSVTGGTGSGATFTLIYVIAAAFTITNAGSGYVEQPTVSFSGGGGSGAAAYATVGGNSVVRGLGATMSFYAPNGEAFRVADGASTSSFYWQALGTSSQGILRSSGASAQGLIQTTGTGGLFLQTNSGVTQATITHTASAVNYVQVTGAATGATTGVQISAQGSDSAIPIRISAKGGSGIIFSGNGSSTQFTVENTSSSVNYLTATGSISGSGAVLKSQGTDTNIDLTLTPKGTGQVKAGGAALNATNGIIINAQTVSTNCTIAATDNAHSIGPITVNSGVSVTVSSGSRWLVM
jgi:hypothetical protein